MDPYFETRVCAAGFVVVVGLDAYHYGVKDSLKSHWEMDSDADMHQGDGEVVLEELAGLHS